ncbi:hypothetical protein EVAR_48940_1 [Eumeta japonica]|uniref:Uncharacterized protein n=1 Tax=Eumeta variegata TaxID=151549 RepID=A0A4C1Y6F9_EUMVA|nr:hypothetical protein EVAR_48940_1 [Eumeta japonica]
MDPASCMLPASRSHTPLAAAESAHRLRRSDASVVNKLLHISNPVTCAPVAEPRARTACPAPADGTPARAGAALLRPADAGDCGLDLFRYARLHRRS